MLTLQFPSSHDRPLQVLCLGAHSDDIEIGCGGTILRLFSENDNAEVCCVVLGSTGHRDAEALLSAQIFLAGARKKEILIRNFKASFFPYVGDQIKSFFEELKERISPDLVFTHYRNDLHQDHRLFSQLRCTTYRNSLLL